MNYVETTTPFPCTVVHRTHIVPQITSPTTGIPPALRTGQIRSMGSPPNSQHQTAFRLRHQPSRNEGDASNTRLYLHIFLTRRSVSVEWCPFTRHHHPSEPRLLLQVGRLRSRPLYHRVDFVDGPGVPEVEPTEFLGSVDGWGTRGDCTL